MGKVSDNRGVAFMLWGCCVFLLARLLSNLILGKFHFNTPKNWRRILCTPIWFVPWTQNMAKITDKRSILMYLRVPSL